MKRLLAIIGFVLLIGSSPALAVCPGTLQLKDNANVTANGKYVDDGSGNCQPSVIIGANQGEAGTPGTGYTQPTGGTGLSGWLSGIYHALTGTLTVTGTVTANAGTNLNTSALATSANQTTANTSLATIASNTGAPIPAGTATIGNVNGAPNVTPTDCSGTIAAGGTAQAAISAQTTLHGFTIANIDSTAGSGEPVWISFTTTAAASTAGSYPLAAPTATTFAGLNSFTTPPGFGTNHAVSIVGATTGHKFSCTWW